MARKNEDAAPAAKTPRPSGTSLPVHALAGSKQPEAVLRLQRLIGNRGTQRVMQRVSDERVQRATLYQKSVYGLPHWEVTFVEPDLEEGGETRWQVGFANPRAALETSGSVSTKSGSPSGYGGEGEVKWTQLREGSEVKGGYTKIVEDDDNPAKDTALMNALPADGTRQKYRLTNKNCQHFVASAWRRAGLKPDLAQYLTVSRKVGRDINGALLGTATTLATTGLFVMLAGTPIPYATWAIMAATGGVLGGLGARVFGGGDND